jgi:hypothetical protein
MLASKRNLNFYSQKLALTSPTSDGRSFGIVRSQTKVTKLQLLFDIFPKYHMNILLRHFNAKAGREYQQLGVRVYMKLIVKMELE